MKPVDGGFDVLDKLFLFVHVAVHPAVSATSTVGCRVELSLSFAPTPPQAEEPPAPPPLLSVLLRDIPAPFNGVQDNDIFVCVPADGSAKLWTGSVAGWYAPVDGAKPEAGKLVLRVKDAEQVTSARSP